MVLLARIDSTRPKIYRINLYEENMRKKNKLEYVPSPPETARIAELMQELEEIHQKRLKRETKERAQLMKATVASQYQILNFLKLRMDLQVGMDSDIPPKPPVGHRLARYLQSKCLLRVGYGENIPLTWISRIRLTKHRGHKKKWAMFLIYGCNYCGKYE